VGTVIGKWKQLSSSRDGRGLEDRHSFTDDLYRAELTCTGWVEFGHERGVEILATGPGKTEDKMLDASWGDVLCVEGELTHLPGTEVVCVWQGEGFETGRAEALYGFGLGRTLT
jgi:hypothetical protein